MLRMHKRMGTDVMKNMVVSLHVMHMLIREIEEEQKLAEDNEARGRIKVSRRRRSKLIGLCVSSMSARVGREKGYEVNTGRDSESVRNIKVSL